MKRRGLFGIAAVVAGVAAVVWALAPQRWQLHPAGRSSCQATEGTLREAVLAICGDPDAVGTQPKRPGGDQGLISLCSAPCDRYSERLVFYDCEGRVAAVEPASAMGCVISR